MNYTTEQITFQEVPNEISLSFLIAGCPLKCKGCHSADSWRATSEASEAIKSKIHPINNNVQNQLTTEYLENRIKQYQDMISCVLFLGGEWKIKQLIELLQTVKNTNPSLKTISYSIAAIMAGTLASQNAQAVVNINSSTDYSDNLTVSKMKNIADQQAKDALATARLYDVIKEIAKDPSLSQSTKDYIANNLPSDDVLSNGSTFKLYTSKGSQKTATVDSEPLVRLGAGSTIPLTADNNVDTENVDTIGRNDFVSRFSNFAGKTSDGVVSVGDKASGKYRTITNVSAGRLNFDSTDAVNGSQLHSTNVALDYLANKFKNDMFSITTNQVENGHSSEFDSYNVNHVQSGSVINYKEGKNISINYSQSSTPDHSEAMNPEPNPLHNIVIKTKDDLVANSYTVTGQNGKNDAVLNNDGLNMGNRTISNLKDGVQDNDAVNVSQLNKVKKQLDGIGTGGNATGDVYFSDNTGKKHMLL